MKQFYHLYFLVLIIFYPYLFLYIDSYYPDVYIPKENRIIEVKSDYTLNKELDRNKAKFNATKELGYCFQLEIR